MNVLPGLKRAQKGVAV